MLKDIAATKLWFSHFCKSYAELTEVIYALEQAQMQLQALHHQELPHGPGIIFLDQQSTLAAVTECIAAYAPLCGHHFIAVSLNALPAGWVWKLLGAGASEVFIWKSSDKPLHSILARLQYWEKTNLQLKHLQNTLIGNSKVVCNIGRKRICN